MKITFRSRPQALTLQTAASVIRQKRGYNRGQFDQRKKLLLPFIAYARILGLRRLNDILEVAGPRFAQEYPDRKPLARATLQRAMKRLAELGLDPGLDDLSTARKLGRPTRGQKSTSERFD